MSARHADAGEELIDIGRPIGGADFDRLLEGGVKLEGPGPGFQWIGLGTHVHIGRPAEGYAHQHRAVAIAPAHVGGGFLMRHEAEVGRGGLVAKSGEGGRKLHHAGNHAAGIIADFAVVEHTVSPVLHHPHVDVEA